MKTLAMLKMEKNFVAVLEKNYPRFPYRKFTIRFLIDRLQEEWDELLNAYAKLDYAEMKKECADLSNLVDYIFEAICSQETRT